MNTVSNSRRLLLLVEPSSSHSVDIRNWLTHRGLRTWWANDVSHAIEELSDFTVKNRPDVVMLEASPINECLKALTADLCGTGGDDISVIAVSKGGPTSRQAPFFAADLDQLETIIDTQYGRPAADRELNCTS